MPNKLYPITSTTIFRFLSSKNEIVVDEPLITIRNNMGSVKLLYRDENGTSVLPNPFRASSKGQFTLWTSAEREHITITAQKGRSIVTIPYLHNAPNVMIVSSVLPIDHQDDQGNDVEGLEPDFIGQDYLYELEEPVGVYTRRLFKSYGLTRLDWLELRLL